MIICLVIPFNLPRQGCLKDCSSCGVKGIRSAFTKYAFQYLNSIHFIRNWPVKMLPELRDTQFAYGQKGHCGGAGFPDVAAVT